MNRAESEVASRRPGAVGDGLLMQVAALLARPRGPIECVAWAVNALACATLLRIAIGAITGGVPLVLYFPAVSIIALFTGWECGLIALVASALLAWYLFFPPVLTPHVPTPQQWVALALWAVVGGTQVAIAHFLRQALQRTLHSEARYRKLLDAAAGSIWTANHRGEIEFPQASWTALTGMAWPSYAGRNWLDAVHPEDRSKLAALGEEPAAGAHHVEVRLWSATAEDWRWHVARSVQLPCLTGGGTEWITSINDVHEHKLAAERRDMIIGELRHRLKNLLTIIDALAKSSRSRLQTEEPVEAFLKRFLGRLHALGAAADLVVAGKHLAVECGAVVRATLSPFMEERADRFSISGPQLPLSEETGGTLGLAVHELATNAVKYGALSTEKGGVSVTWSVTPTGTGEEEIVFEWKEEGGPPAAPPNREGFGTRLIRSVPARERNGRVDIRYDPDGLSCRIAFNRPLEGPPATARIAAE